MALALGSFVASGGGAAGKYEIHYAVPQLALFSVPIVHEKVRMLFEERGFNPYYGRVLKSIDPATKRATFEHRLRARGCSDAELAHLTCPIGLAGVAGKQPEVIAVAVAAQLLQLIEPSG